MNNYPSVDFERMNDVQSKVKKLSNISTPDEAMQKANEAKMNMGRAIELFLTFVNRGKMSHATLGKKRDGSAFLFTMNRTDTSKCYGAGADLSLLSEDIIFKLIEELGEEEEEGDGEDSIELPF